MFEPLFLCSKCHAWVPWSKGCADAHLEWCDDCWHGRHHGFWRFVPCLRCIFYRLGWVN